MAKPKSDGRMIRESISDSKKFGELSDTAAVLFCMLIPHYNPHGKMPGGPAYIKEIICPYRKSLTLENLPTYLQEISDKTNVKWFQLDGRWWIHSLHFLSEHQNIEVQKLGKDKLPSYPEQSREQVADYSPTLKSESPTLKSESPTLKSESPTLKSESPTRILKSEDSRSTNDNANVNVNVNENDNTRTRKISKIEKQDPLPDDFEPDRVTSDTPLPPVLQGEWEHLMEIYPQRNGIIKGRNSAVRIFAKSCERWRIMRNALHYAETDDAKRGFAMGLDKFCAGDYRDYDHPEGPLGQNTKSIASDLSVLDQIKKWKRELLENEG
jgi:hypothetical protein